MRGSCDDFQNIFRNDEVCNFGAKKMPGGSYEVGLFGDLMADHWTPLVAQLAGERNLSGRQVTNGGCVLLFNTEIPAKPASKARECARYQQEAAKFLDANPGLKIAVISAYWEKWIGLIEDGHAIGRDPAMPPASGAAAALPKFDLVLAHTLKIFTDRGIKVVLIGQIPTYEALPVRCILRALRAHSEPAVCGKTRVASAEELARSNAALERAAAAARDQVTLSLPLTYMCQEQTCSPVLNGTMLYKNKDHVNRYGARELRRFVEFPAVP